MNNLEKNDRYRRIKKSNLQYVIIGSSILILFNLVKYGFCERNLMQVICTSIGGFIIPSIVCRLKIPELAQICIMNWSISISCLIYGALVGGSSNTFYIYFLFLIVSTMYFDKKVILYISVPLCVVAVFFIIMWPESIDGKGASVMGALTKAIYYAFAIFIAMKASKIGEDINQTSIDALTQLKENFAKSNDIAKDLNNTVIDSNHSVAEIVSQINNIKNSSAEMNKALIDMTQGISNVNNSISVAQSFINENAGVTEDLTDKYNQVVKIVNEGTKNISNTKNSMNAMHKSVYEAVEVSDDLISQMQQINNILEQINSVASQTNLLSLNASIEAARAGEHGLGFAVVANEIRSLSEESSVAANNIREIITSLNNQVENVFNKIEEGARASKTSFNEVDNLTNILTSISKETSDFENIIKKDTIMVNNISNEFNSIANEVNLLYEVSEKNSSMLSSIHMSIEEQNESIQNLDKKMLQVNTLADSIVQE